MAAVTANFFNGLFSRSADPVRSRARISLIARLLDSAYTIPGTKIRVGLDPLIGLIPGAGDAITTALSAYVVYEAYRAGLPPIALLRMALNVLIDLIISVVPGFGDFGDIFWRANLRNLAIFDEHLAAQRSNIIEGTWRTL